MVNARLVYELEKKKCIPLFQSGFRKGRSTLDNIIQLENKIRNAFVRRNHLVSIFFDIEKAYDRTWRYEILRTLFDFGFRGNLPTFIQNFLNLRTFSASLYVDDLQISCEGSDMRMIERQLQTAVHNISRRTIPRVIFDRRLTFIPHILQLRKRCEKVFKPLEGVVKHLLGDGSNIITPSVSGNRTLSHRLRMCCIRISVQLYSEKLDPVHHMALRICSGAFRTSPVQSLYVTCNQLPLDLRRRKLTLTYYFKILSVPSHPLHNVYMGTSMKRLYDARPSNIRPFMDRMKLHFSELDLPNVHIQQRNLFLFQPWNTTCGAV
ncbi:putative RNA-directed DNA polymerase from transposon X-element [Trichonephila clavipes]|nr:putative RNA-directed DNA polymerase from transposon X-element [Trichonephila clavipes]